MIALVRKVVSSFVDEELVLKYMNGDERGKLAAARNDVLQAIRARFLEEHRKDGGAIDSRECRAIPDWRLYDLLEENDPPLTKSNKNKPVCFQPPVAVKGKKHDRKPYYAWRDKREREDLKQGQINSSPLEQTSLSGTVQNFTPLKEGSARVEIPNFLDVLCT